MKISLLALLGLPLLVAAQTAPLLDISDPEGDDSGDGTLVYPRSSAFGAGDLDLRGLKVYAESGVYRFEATFANPIRHPSTVRGMGLGAEDLSVFARHGFYAFNLDLYVDTDRVPGSGTTATLPGRRARISPAHAWERAIVLTPRPELMRRQLMDALAESTATGAGPVPVAAVDASVYFVTDARVRGRTISFTVPQRYIGAAAPADWSITGLVTAAKVSIETSLGFAKPNTPAVERLALGAMQPEPGRPEFGLGYSGDQPPASSVVDLLSPNLRQQAMQLARGAELTGLNRDNRMGQNALPAFAAAAVPAQAAPTVGESSSWLGRALDVIASLFGGATAGTSAAPTSASPASMQTLLQPAAPAAPGAAAIPAPPAAAPAAPVLAPVPTPSPATKPPVPTAPAAPAAASAQSTTSAAGGPRSGRDAAFFEEQELRMRTLKRLRDSGLISEDEYQRKRKEVLDGL